MQNVDHLSISALNLHNKNPRRFVLTYLERLREGPSEHLSLGLAVHKYLEERTVRGSASPSFFRPNELKVMQDWEKEFYPKYGDRTRWNSETMFNVKLDLNLPPMMGIIDLFRYDPLTRGTLVFDHKTATERYKETKKSLLENWQLVLYCYALNPDLDHDFIIGHNQFIKYTKAQTREKKGDRLKCYKIITNVLTKDIAYDIIEDIKEEMASCVKTIERYKQGGLKVVRHTPENKYWYGSLDPFWSIISEKETIDEFRIRTRNFG